MASCSRCRSGWLKLSYKRAKPHEFEAQSDVIAELVRIMQRLTAKASAIVLAGFELRSDVNIIPSPERYVDPRGKVMWERVEELLSTEAAKTAPVPPRPRYLSHGDPPVQSNRYEPIAK